MQSKQNWDSQQMGSPAAQLVKNRDAVARLAKSGDAQRLIELLRHQNGVQEAARAAAGGDASQLMTIMNQLMNTKEGANLVERIEHRAKQEGLK